MMLETVIFDMDGVLVDSEPVHQENERALFTELGLEISEEEHNSYVGRSAMDVWKIIIERHKLDTTPEALLAMGRDRYLTILREDNRVQLIPGSVELADHLKDHGLNVLLASSASRRTILAVLEHFNVLDRFSVITSATDVPQSKPHPDIFLKAAAQVPTPPQKCLVIEDSTNGVHAAKSAGMWCIGYASSSAMSQDLTSADHVVSNLSDIDLRLLDRLTNQSF